VFYLQKVEYHQISQKPPPKENIFIMLVTPISKKWSFLTLVGVLLVLSSCAPDESRKKEALQSLLGQGYGINNLSLVVQDIDSTRKYYSETLGFMIPPSDEYDKGIFEHTIKTSIRFPDMSSIELLSIVDSIIISSEDSFIKAFLEKQEGVQMYSLSSSSADSTFAWLSSKEFKMDSIKSYRRSDEAPEGWDNDDGGPDILNVNLENKQTLAHLPQFVELTGFPYERMHEWESFYNMQRGFINHPNGVVGVVAIKVVVEELEAALEEFHNMGLYEETPSESRNLARFKIKRNQELHVISPQSPDDESSKFLMDRGSGVFGICFEVKNLEATYDTLKTNLPEEALLFDSLSKRLTIPSEYAYGIQLEFIEEPEEQAMIAERLKMNFRSKLDSAAISNAEGMYAKYCALCHGDNREGYAADFAPSLRSHSLLGTSKTNNFLRYTIQYGREGTAMAGYYKEQGGPLSYLEIELLLKWLEEKSGVEEPIELPKEAVVGDVELGAEIYAQNCATCHGKNGEGISAPALGNPLLLATASDQFLRYAISEGRDSTNMPAFKDSLSNKEIDAVTVFLRSRASGWDVPKGDTISIPSPEDYVMNPNNAGPNFNLRENLYVSAEQLNQALKDSVRLLLLDARSTVAWRQTHIPGAIPVPYYEEPEDFIEHIPNDSTWIVAYCACPHAASGKVINTLKRYGYQNTAILDEGILVWTQMGYPVQYGQ